MFDIIVDLLSHPLIDGILLFVLSWIALDLLTIYLYFYKKNGGDKK